MDYKKKVVYQSNYWYNDGLAKAKVRDMTGAILSLKKSLQYNRGNIAARNLLGLVYYGRGDVVEGLVEWILSKNFQPKDNIAGYFIKKVQETPGELEQINQAVKRYNQALEYARQGGDDVAIIQLKKAVAAHPTYVRAYQLLGLLYMETEQYASARQVLRKAQKLDATDEFTVRYLHELGEIRKERPKDVKRQAPKKKQAVSYKMGNDTIIQPVPNVLKEKNRIRALLNIAVGLVIGLAVMWFLIMPAVTSARQKDANQQSIEFSNQIAEQKAQISALKTELEGYRADSAQNENVQATAESTKDSYEIVMNISKHYKQQDMGNDAMVEELLKINPESLGTSGREAYDEVSGNLFPSVCKKLYNAAKEGFENENYDTVITNLEKVMQMNDDYEDGAAALLLAQAYSKTGKDEQAAVLYQKIVEAHAGTEAAETAQNALNAQDADDNQDAQDKQDGQGNQGAQGEQDTQGN